MKKYLNIDDRKLKPVSIKYRLEKQTECQGLLFI